MTKLWYIPLEHLDKRYTIMMDKQILNELRQTKISFERIYGEELTQKIETGFFLDSIGTNYFKFSQLMKIMELFRDKKIKDGDVFFFSDLWFPGIEAIRYVTGFLKMSNIKIVGIMHAGSWTETDDVRTYMELWAKHIERGWFEMIDMVFVGSNHHKKEIIKQKRTSYPNKIIPTGLAFNTKDIYKIIKPLPWNKRENIVVFPHRIHWEKQPEVFDKFMEKHSDYKGIKTMEHNLNKEEYFKLLAKSKFAFSSALQENFGYGMFEATALGCIPIVPNRLAYKEYYQSKFLYKTIDDAHKIFNKYKYIENFKPINIELLNDGVKRMIFYMGKVIKNDACCC